MNIEASYINYYFDHVYVLNLEHRPDRKITMLQKLSRLGIQAEFVQAVNGYSNQNKLEHQNYLDRPIGGVESHPLEIIQQRKLIASPGAWGYLKTYIGILEDAKKRGFERILCLDDDVLFHNDFESNFQNAAQEIPDDWKLLYLGASQYVWKIPEGLSYPDENQKTINSKKPFYFPNNTDGSFAIGLHVSVFEILISDILKMNCPLDSGPLRMVIKAHPKKCFVLNPNVVIADVSESDIREGQDQHQISEQLKWNLEEYNSPFNQDLVSIIMPTYNAENTIEKAIRSILLQSYKTIELIVVNDASSDNTETIVKQIIQEDERVQYISLEENLGVGGARNVGLKAAKGSIIGFQDADDISLKNRISYQLIPIYEKGTQFSVCRFYRSRCSHKELDIYDQDATLDLVKSRRVKNEIGLYDYGDTADVGLVTVIYKRIIFEKYGLFDEHRFGEDLEMIERILFHKLNITFGEKFNGHTFLSNNKTISKTFYRIDRPMYISPEMNQNNLTTQYLKKKKEVKSIQQNFRTKYLSGNLNQFIKLPPNSTKDSTSTYISYNTLKLDTFIVLSEIDYQMLWNQVLQAKEVEKLYPSIENIYNSLSWKITAPLRGIVGAFKMFINLFK